MCVLIALLVCVTGIFTECEKRDSFFLFTTTQSQTVANPMADDVLQDDAASEASITAVFEIMDSAFHLLSFSRQKRVQSVIAILFYFSVFSLVEGKSYLRGNRRSHWADGSKESMADYIHRTDGKKRYV